MHRVDDRHADAVVVWQAHDLRPARTMLLEMLITLLTLERLPFKGKPAMFLVRAWGTACLRVVIIMQYCHRQQAWYSPPRRYSSLYRSFPVAVPAVHGASLWFLSASPLNLHIAG